MQIVKVPQLAWHNPGDLELFLPEEWRLEIPYMTGYNRPGLKPEEIWERLKIRSAPNL